MNDCITLILRKISAYNNLDIHKVRPSYFFPANTVAHATIILYFSRPALHLSVANEVVFTRYNIDAKRTKSLELPKFLRLVFSLMYLVANKMDIQAELYITLCFQHEIL